MWGSSWSVAAGLITIGVVLIAALLTAWSPIFAILIVLAIVPLIGAGVAARRVSGSPETSAPEREWSADHAPDTPVDDVSVGGGMVSDRERAGPQ